MAPPQPAGRPMSGMPSMYAESVPQAGVTPIQGGAVNVPAQGGANPPWLPPSGQFGKPSTPGVENLGGNWFTGKTKSIPTMPSDIKDLRGGTIQMLGNNLGQVFGQTADDPSRVNAGYAGNVDPMMLTQQFGLGGDYDIRSLLSQFGGGGGGGGTGGGSGINIDSVDTLGGENSAFFKNMMAQFSPAFAQRRAEALAAAKESSGNLTGSGFANALGTTVNRSLGDEQERLANVGMEGIKMELGRQGQLAELANSRAMSGASGAVAHQGNLMNFILGRAGLDLEGQKMGLQQGMSNQDAALRAGMGNQSTRQGSMDLQSKMDFDREMAMYNARNNMSNSNSDRYTQLLNNMTTTGVGPNQVTKSGGVSGFLSGLLNVGGQIAGAGGFNGLFNRGKSPNGMPPGVPMTSNTPWTPSPWSNGPRGV
jgi:hypothetical protein